MGEVTNLAASVITNEKVNLFEALAMAGDMTIYGQRDNVKLIREDAQGHREIIPWTWTTQALYCLLIITCSKTMWFTSPQ